MSGADGWRSRPGGKRQETQVRPSLRPERLVAHVAPGTLAVIDAYAEGHPTTYAGTDTPRPLTRGMVVEHALRALAKT